MFCKKFCKMFCKNVLQKKFCIMFCRKAFAKMFCKKFCKMFCKDFSPTKEFSWDGLFLFPIFKRVLLFSNTKLKNTSLLVLHYQYPQQCGDRSHQVDDQEYLWPRPENAKGCSLCFLREINRTNFLRQYVYFSSFGQIFFFFFLLATRKTTYLPRYTRGGGRHNSTCIKAIVWLYERYISCLHICNTSSHSHAKICSQYTKIWEHDFNNLKSWKCMQIPCSYLLYIKQLRRILKYLNKYLNSYARLI